MSSDQIIETLEGNTRLFVPQESMSAQAPPHEPAFYNPRASLTRDISVIVCAAFARSFAGQTLVLESHAGLGARGVRVANESEGVHEVVLNDLNPRALELATRSAKLNSCEDKVSTTENEACRFLSERSRQGQRGLIVDVDPFGSPSRYIDCAIRACAHGGILSVTATDLQVLHGIFASACFRRYGGEPIRRTSYSKEIALRLIIGCMRSVAARMDVTIDPVFCETDMHYYRVYTKILNKTDTSKNIGLILDCQQCGRRKVAESHETCECGEPTKAAGPLWTGRLYDAAFAKSASSEIESLSVSPACSRLFARAAAESEMPACYYTLDEVFSRARASPMRLERMLGLLKDAGYSSSPTSLDPTGFRTSATMPQILGIL